MKTKILKIVLLFFIITTIFTISNNVYAITYSINESIVNTIDNFCDSLENDNRKVYTYIDTENRDLYNNIGKYIYSIKKLECPVKQVNTNNGITTVKTGLKAKGDNWNVEGFTVRFDLKLVNGKYVITDTDLFDIISPEHTAKFAVTIVTIVFAVIGGIILVTAVTVVIVVIVVTNNKKNKDNKVNNENKEDKEK